MNGEQRRRVVRAVEVLERIGDGAAQRLLTALASGASASQVTTEAQAALERLTQADLDRP